MSKVAIVTDSTASLPSALVDQYQIRVGPLLVIWGDKTYQDLVDIQPREFYSRLETASRLPTTSQVTPASFHTLFNQALQEGKDVLAILISSKLSGTVDSAIQAKEMFPGARIEIVDTMLASMAEGFVVLEAARAAEAGASLAECKALAERALQHVGVYFMVDTLKYLHKGGRIGGAARLLGTALNLKPILELVDGVIEPSDRVRTSQKAQARLVELVEKSIAGRRPVRLATMHANAPDQAASLLDLAKTRIPAVESYICELSPVIGTHTGPGTLALTYIAGL